MKLKQQTMNTTETLSENAKRLLEFLIKSNGAWEGKCMEEIFNKPKYPEGEDRDGKIKFWQWEADAYGTEVSRPIASNEGLLFAQKVEVPYSSQLSVAYQELKKLGLADEKNSGYNDYFFYATNKTK